MATCTCTSRLGVISSVRTLAESCRWSAARSKYSLVASNARMWAAGDGCGLAGTRSAWLDGGPLGAATTGALGRAMSAPRGMGEVQRPYRFLSGLDAFWRES